MFTQHESAIIVDALKSVKINAIKGGNPCGICSNYDDELYGGEGVTSARKLMKLYAEDWEFFSGCTTYPIPSTNKRWPVASIAYDKYLDGGKWRGQQKKLRFSLIDHLIACVERDTV